MRLVVFVAAVLVLAGCGAPDYGGHDSDANSWPKSDETSKSEKSSGKKPQGRPTRSASPSAPAKHDGELRIPPTLAGELLNHNFRVFDPEGDMPAGLTDVRGGYGNTTRPVYALVVSTGKPRTLRQLDRWYRKNHTSLGTVGRATCATFVDPLPATGCWRSDGVLTVAVSGSPETSFGQLAEVLAEAWTYAVRPS